MAEQMKTKNRSCFLLSLVATALLMSVPLVHAEQQSTVPDLPEISQADTPAVDLVIVSDNSPAAAEALAAYVVESEADVIIVAVLVPDETPAADTHTLFTQSDPAHHEYGRAPDRNEANDIDAAIGLSHIAPPDSPGTLQELPWFADVEPLRTRVTAPIPIRYIPFLS